MSASVSTLDILPTLAIACLPEALKPEGQAWVADLRKLVHDPASNPADMSAVISRLPALLQHLSKPFLAFSSSIIVADLKQYLPSPTVEGSAAAAVAAGLEGVGELKKEDDGEAGKEGVGAVTTDDERNRKALEKIVAGVLDLMLSHQALVSRPPPPPPPSSHPSSSSAGPSSLKRASSSNELNGSGERRKRRREKERYKGIIELTDAEIDTLAKNPEPERYKEWLQRTFVPAPESHVSQSAFWTSYTSTFRPALERLGSAMPALLSPGEAIKNVSVVFEGAAPKMAGEGDTKSFVIQGIEVRPPQSPVPESATDEDDDQPSNAEVLDRLDAVENKLDRLLRLLEK